MKKILFLLLLLVPLNVNAKKVDVTFSGCTDGDTAKFIMKDAEIKVRFLAIDTPETVHPNKGVEAYGKDASEYTCNKITNATNIVLEFDPDSDETDKYNRYLAWIFVDGSLLQKELVEVGYAKVAYLYGDYIYTKDLEAAQTIAQNNKVGIWSDYEPAKDYTVPLLVVGGLAIFLVYILNKKGRKKINKEFEKAGSKQIKKILKDFTK